MSTFLTIHTRYKDVQLGLFNKSTLVDWSADESKRISKNFISLMSSLLTRNNLSLKDLCFVAAHQGPAPFTTLRVSLASVNGLAFATQIPLVGVNGLEVFLEEQHHREYTTIALLNAFCQDVYYGIYDGTQKLSIGYGAAEKVIAAQAEYYSGTVYYIGNGVQLYTSLIRNYFGARALIPHTLPELASLSAIGATAYIQWQEKRDIARQLMPLYIKEYSAVLSPSFCQPTS